MPRYWNNIFLFGQECSVIFFDIFNNFNLNIILSKLAEIYTKRLATITGPSEDRSLFLKMCLDRVKLFKPFDIIEFGLQVKSLPKFLKDHKDARYIIVHGVEFLPFINPKMIGEEAHSRFANKFHKPMKVKKLPSERASLETTTPEDFLRGISQPKPVKMAPFDKRRSSSMKVSGHFILNQIFAINPNSFEGIALEKAFDLIRKVKETNDIIIMNFIGLHDILKSSSEFETQLFSNYLNEEKQTSKRIAIKDEGIRNLLFELGENQVLIIKGKLEEKIIKGALGSNPHIKNVLLGNLQEKKLEEGGNDKNLNDHIILRYCTEKDVIRSMVCITNQKVKDLQFEYALVDEFIL